MVAPSVRAWLYDYLARLFDGSLHDLPDPPDEVSPEWLRGSIEGLRAIVAQAPLDVALAEHTRLFVNAPGGVAAPPYASWYLDGGLCGPAAEWVARAYAAYGVELVPEAGEPPDYLGVELEFMHFLARHELAARTTGDQRSLDAILDSERAFMTLHLAQWVPAFSERVRVANPSPLYASAVALLEAVLRHDALTCNELEQTTRQNPVN